MKICKTLKYEKFANRVLLFRSLPRISTYLYRFRLLDEKKFSSIMGKENQSPLLFLKSPFFRAQDATGAASARQGSSFSQYHLGMWTRTPTVAKLTTT